MSEEGTVEETPVDTGEAPADATPTAMDAPVEAPAEPQGWYSGAEDWREQMAGEDESRLNQLKRITDPNQLVENYFAAQDMIRKGETQMADANVLPENATEEQIAAYRERNGIPESADGYDLKLSEGLVMSDQDRQDFQPLFEHLHENNVPADMASGIVDKYMQIQNAMAAADQAQDVTDANTATMALQEAWGPDFETNKSLVQNMFAAHLPEESMESFMNARLAGGQALFNHPGVVAAFANMARIINPAAALVPAGADALRSMETRRAELEEKMGTSEWYKRQDWQTEYQNILEAQDQLNNRQAG
jgi:hypothetical protein